MMDIPASVPWEAGLSLVLLLVFLAANIVLHAQYRAKSKQLSQRSRELELESGERKRGDEILRLSGLRLRHQNDALSRLAKMDAFAPGEFRGAMQTLTEITATTLDIERSSIWLFDEQRASITCVDLYERTPGRHSEGLVLTEADYPSYFEAMKEEHTIAANDARTDPRTREFTDSYLEVIGITSMLDAPIRVGGRMIGVCCNEHVGDPRYWPIDEQNFSGAVADFAALILETRERTRAEGELRRSEEYFRSIINNALDAVVTIQMDGRISGWNPQAEATFGWRAGEAIGQDIGKLIVPPSYRDAHDHGLRQYAETGRMQVSNRVREMSALHRDGREFPIEITLTSTRVRGESIVTAFIRDITERKRADQERARLLAFEQELDVANRIQQSILPKVFPEFAGKQRMDIHATMIPAKDVAGDFYDFFALDDRRLAFVIGDVSGKGVPAAIFMATCRTFLKAIAQDGGPPGECLTRLNTMLCADNVAELYVTLAYGILDTDTGAVTYSLAGHPCPIIIRREGATHPVEMAGGTILGVFPQILYANATAQLNPGDGLFLYTDGVTESMDAERRPFGESRLNAYLRKGPASLPVRSLVEGVIAEVDRHADSAHRHDDTTVLAIRYLATGN